MLGLPLAITAACMTQPLLVFPLGVCAWWWTPRRWGWEWTAVMGLGLVGTEWALIGANAIAAFPAQRLIVEVSWVLSAAALGLVSYFVDRKG